MRHILQKIGICGALFIAVPASAEPYFYMLRSMTREAAHFYDAGSVIKNGDHVLVWIKSVTDKKPRPKRLPYMMTRLSVRCKDQTLQALWIATYENGKSAGTSFDPKDEVRSVVPDTNGAHWLNAACHPGFPLNVPYTAQMSNEDIDNGKVFRLYDAR